jgi:hypothetical protein
VPTTTALEARLRIFQPSQKPVLKEIHLNTSWGTAVVKGRLGQRHADVLEAVRACALETKKIDDGLILLVDPHEIRKRIGTGYYSHQQMTTLLKELTEAIVSIETDDISAVGHFIDYTEEAKKPVLDKRGRERYWMIVKLGKIGLQLLTDDFKLYYDPTPISKLRYGISQAVARFALTHRNVPSGGWKVDTIIRAVAGDVNNHTLRNYRIRINEDADNGNLNLCSIHVENNRVFIESDPQPPISDPQPPISDPQPPISDPQPPK